MCKFCFSLKSFDRNYAWCIKIAKKENNKQNYEK